MEVMKSVGTKYTSILKYTGLFGGIQGLSMLIGIVRNKLVVLLLGPEGMGLISIFNSTIKWISDSTNLGLPISGVRSISPTLAKGGKEQAAVVRVIRSWSLLLALFGLLVCFLMSPLLNEWAFGSEDHTVQFMLLSPIIAFMAITGGETALLKGTRQLRRLAILSIYNVVTALVCSVPLLYFWREAAIVPMLLVVSLSQMLITLCFSYRLYPPRFSLRGEHLGKGVDMIWLGISFAVAGILGSGSEFAIRTLLNRMDSLDVVGLYSAGYILPIIVAGLVFSSLDSEYYPRLSSIHGTGSRLNDAVNSQIEVCQLLLSPIMMAFLFALPVLLPLLYSGKFLPVIGMIQVMSIAMYFRGMVLPVAYLPLAKGDSRTYLLMEACYDVVVVLLVVLGFRHFGLIGCGIGILVTLILDMVLLYSYMHHRFRYVVSGEVVRYALIHIPLLSVGYVFATFTSSWAYCVAGIVLTSVSAGVSVYLSRSKE